MKNIIIMSLFLGSFVFADGTIDLQTCEWVTDGKLNENPGTVYSNAVNDQSKDPSCKGTVMCFTKRNKGERIVFGNVKCPFNKSIDKTCDQSKCLSMNAPEWLKHEFKNLSNMTPKIINLKEAPVPIVETEVEKKIEFTKCKWAYGQSEQTILDVAIDGKVIKSMCMGDVDCYIPDYDNYVTFAGVKCDKKESDNCKPTECLNLKDLELDSKYLTTPGRLAPFISGRKVIYHKEAKAKKGVN